LPLTSKLEAVIRGSGVTLSSIQYRSEVGTSGSLGIVDAACRPHRRRTRLAWTSLARSGVGSRCSTSARHRSWPSRGSLVPIEGAQGARRGRCSKTAGISPQHAAPAPERLDARPIDLHAISRAHELQLDRLCRRNLTGREHICERQRTRTRSVKPNMSSGNETCDGDARPS